MNSILSYLGGKSHLSNEIISRIPEHVCYVEPFAGAAWVYFRKPKSKVEILNDINSDLVNLYRIIRSHYDEFIRCCEFLPVSREEHNEFRKESNNIKTLTDIERAVRFYYSMCCGYAGKLDSVFVCGTTRKPKFRYDRIKEVMKEANERLFGAIIENMNYDKVIERYDREYTFFYIDPPYYDCEDYYGKDIFTKEDFYKLSEQLTNIKGKFILSLNDTPEIREIFKQFRYDEVSVPYSVANAPGARKKVAELLIYNF